MLQKTEELIEFVNILHKRGHTVEMFTNGTLLYPERLLDTCFFVMDWKLPGSGEANNTFGMNNKNRIDNFYQLCAADAVKFTIASQEDFVFAATIYQRYWIDERGKKPLEHYPQVFAGIVWDKGITNEQLVDLILKNDLPWRLNVQVHNHIWDRSQRGI